MAVLATWSGTTDPFTNGTGGSSELRTGVDFPTTWVDVTRDNSGAYYAQWDWAHTDVGAIRLYFQTPQSEWPSASRNLFLCGDSATGPRFTLSGAGSPGSLRLIGNSGQQLANSPRNILELDTWYRGELQFNLSTSEARMAVFPLQYDIPIWETDWITGVLEPVQDKFRLGSWPNAQDTLKMGFTHLRVTDDINQWIGRVPGDQPPAEDLPVLEWDAPPLPDLVPSASNGTLALVESEGFPQNQLLFTHSGSGSLYVEYSPIVPLSEVSLRAYVRTPDSWPSAARSMISFMNNFAEVLRCTFSGTGQPGNLRLTGAGGVTLASSGNQLIQPGRWYRFEMQANVDEGLQRLCVWYLGSDVPLWQSGWIEDSFVGPITSVRVGWTGNNPSIAPIHMGGLLAVDSIEENWIGRHEDDQPVPLVMTVWDGSQETSVTMSLWTGSNEISVQNLTLP